MMLSFLWCAIIFIHNCALFSSVSPGYHVTIHNNMVYQITWQNTPSYCSTKILMTGTSQTVIRDSPLFCFLRLSNLLSQPHPAVNHINWKLKMVFRHTLLLRPPSDGLHIMVWYGPAYFLRISRCGTSTSSPYGWGTGGLSWPGCQGCPHNWWHFHSLRIPSILNQPHWPVERMMASWACYLWTNGCYNLFPLSPSWIPMQHPSPQRQSLKTLLSAQLYCQNLIGGPQQINRNVLREWYFSPNTPFSHIPPGLPPAVLKPTRIGPQLAKFVRSIILFSNNSHSRRQLVVEYFIRMTSTTFFTQCRYVNFP